MFARIALVIALLSPSLAFADDFDLPVGCEATSPPMSECITSHFDGCRWHCDVAIDAEPVLLAQADTGSAGLASDAGSSSGSAAAPQATPADKLHDPAEHPAQAWDDLKATKKVGWPLAVFAGLIMLCKLLGRAKKYKLAAFLSKGKTPVIIGMAGALAIACFNAAAEGGAWTAVFVAGVTALAHYHDADPKTETE